jgi:DNA-binding transcriptional ArsR family regulator
MKHRKRPYDRSAQRRRQCKTCVHPERSRIEALLAGGASLDSIGRKFGLSKDTLHRHLKNHIHPDDLEILRSGPAALADLAEKAAAESMSVLDYLGILRLRLMRQLEASSATGDNKGVCRASQTLLAVLQEIGKLTGEIDRVAGIVINNNNGDTTQTFVRMRDPPSEDTLAAAIECGDHLLDHAQSVQDALFPSKRSVDWPGSRCIRHRLGASGIVRAERRATFQRSCLEGVQV